MKVQKFAAMMTTMVAPIVLSGCAGQGFEFAAVPQGSIGSGETPSQVDQRELLENGEEFPISCRKAPQSSVVQFGLDAIAYHSTSGVSTSLDAIRVGTKINRAYRLYDLLVPARSYDSGFPVSGDVLRKDNGEMLKTDYALDLYSSLALGAADEEGYYQFAVLSDDGTTLHLMSEGSSYLPVLSDEGTHGPRVACSSKAIYMKRGARVPFRLTYFQGPAFQIALTVIWRRWDSADAMGATSQCYTSPTIFEADGRTLVRSLRDAGWKALQNDNYVISGSSEVCYYHND